jgi:hypothetical protein
MTEKEKKAKYIKKLVSFFNNMPKKVKKKFEKYLEDHSENEKINEAIIGIIYLSVASSTPNKNLYDVMEKFFK